MDEHSSAFANNHKPTIFWKLSLVLLVIILVVLGVEGYLYLKLINKEKRVNEERVNSETLESGRINKESTPTGSQEKLPIITVFGPALENESSYEQKSNMSRDERLSQAKKVLKEHYSDYDEPSLGREFGVSLHEMGDVPFLVLTGGLKKISQQEIEIDCGDFIHITAIQNGTVINELNKDNSVRYQISIDELKVGDLVSLFYGKRDTQEQRDLWVILKHL